MMTSKCGASSGAAIMSTTMYYDAKPVLDMLKMGVTDGRFQFLRHHAAGHDQHIKRRVAGETEIGLHQQAGTCANWRHRSADGADAERLFRQRRIPLARHARCGREDFVRSCKIEDFHIFKDKDADV